MNIKTVLFCLFCIVYCSSCSANVRRDIDIAFAKASAMEAHTNNVYGALAIDELDIEHPIINNIVDGDGRLFKFIGFKNNTNGRNGYFIVFEMCKGQASEYSQSYSGFSLDINLELKRFNSAENNPTADFPKACFYPDEK
jgi:hypothetical protein